MGVLFYKTSELDTIIVMYTLYISTTFISISRLKLEKNKKKLRNSLRLNFFYLIINRFLHSCSYKSASKFVFVYKNTKEIHEKTKAKNTIRFWLKSTTLVYNYCPCWKRLKSQIIKRISYMAGITQNKHMPYFHCGPWKSWNNKKNKEGVGKSFKDSKTACKQE